MEHLLSIAEGLAVAVIVGLAAWLSVLWDRRTRLTNIYRRRSRVTVQAFSDVAPLRQVLPRALRDAHYWGQVCREDVSELDEAYILAGLLRQTCDQRTEEVVAFFYDQIPALLMDSRLPRLVGRGERWTEQRLRTAREARDAPTEAPPTIIGRYPFDSAKFQDRKEEFDELTMVLKTEPSSRLLLILGRGGMGKSALLGRLCHQIEAGELWTSRDGNQRVAGIVYFTCSAEDQPTFERLYLDLALTASPDQQHDLREALGDISRSVADRTRNLLSRLNQGSYFLVLDNLEDALSLNKSLADPHLAEFVETCLLAPSHLRMIATSREYLVVPQPLQSAVRQVVLAKGLPPECGSRLLAELGLEQLPEDVLEKAALRCEGVPLALTRIAGICGRDSSQPSRRASANSVGLEELLADDSLFNDQVVQRLVEEQYRRLLDAERHVLEGLAVFAKPSSETALIFLLRPFFPDLHVGETLAALLDAYLLQRRQGDALYQLHSFDREYAYSHIPDHGSYCRRILHAQAGRYYLKVAEQLQADRELNTRRKWPADEQMAWAEALADAATQLVKGEAWQELRGHQESLVEADEARIGWRLYREGQDLAESLSEAFAFVGDQPNRARWLGQKANYLHCGGEYDQAIALSYEALSLLKGTDAPALSGSLYFRLGFSLRSQMRYAEALECFSKSSDLRKGAGLLAEAAEAYGSIGPMLEELGQLDAAWDAQEPIATTGCTTLAIWLRRGRIRRRQGHYEEAWELINEAIKRVRPMKVPSSFARYLAEASLTALASGHPRRAEELAAESAVIARGLMAGDRGEMLYQTGVTFQRLGRLEHASQNFREAADYSALAYQYAAHIRLAMIATVEGQPELATSEAERGLQLCSELLGFTPGLYEVLHHRALGQLLLHRPTEALESERAALRICGALGVVEAALVDVRLLAAAPANKPLGAGALVELLQSVVP